MFDGEVCLYNSTNNLICKNRFSGKFDNLVVCLDVSDNNTIENNDLNSGNLFFFGTSLKLLESNKNNIHHS